MNQDKFDPLRSTCRSTWANLRFSLGIFGLGAIVGGFVGIFLFLQITGGSATVSEPISAPTLSLEEFESSQPLQVEVIATEQPIPTAAPTQIAPTEVAVISAEVLPTPTLIPSPTVAPLPTATVPTPKLFRIEAARSQARFSVYETFPESGQLGR